MTTPPSEHLDEPRAQPDYEMQDDMGAYAEARWRQALESSAPLTQEGS